MVSAKLVLIGEEGQPY